VNSFTYNGVNSLDMGLRIESKNVFSAPQYEKKFQAIPGRDGDLILPNGRYPNVQVTYTVFLPAKALPELREKLTAVKAWLYTEPDRYHELLDTYDTESFRRAVINTQLDITDQLNKIGLFTVSFSCLPFKYLNSGTVPVRIMSSPFALTNPTAFPAKPYVKVSGSGEGRISVGQSHWDLSDIDGYIEIDSEQMNFYKGAEPRNDRVTGDGFPILYPGVNSVSFAGDFTSVTIEPRWVTL
jgi:phage-related protein